MRAVNPEFFTYSRELRLRDVTLSSVNRPETNREKSACILLAEIGPFVSLQDTKGTTLEINRAGLEGAGPRLNEIWKALPGSVPG